MLPIDQCMRLSLLLLLLLGGCSADESEEGASGTCGERFCVSASAQFLAKQEVADFNTYQVEWGGKRFGIYEGDFPSLSHVPPSLISLPVDSEAELRIDGSLGIVSAQVADDWPRFLEITGPCSSTIDCAVADFAKTVALVR